MGNIADDSSHDHDLYSSLPKEKSLGDQFLYQFNGFWFFLPNLKAIQKVLQHFKPLPTDVILASFPKTGTTWLKSLLYCIIHRSSKQSLVTNHPHELVPFLEFQVFGVPRDVSSPPDHNLSTTSTTNSPSTRIFSTHIPYQLLGNITNISDCRLVCVTREPKDTLVSMWHFANKWGNAEEELLRMEVAVEKFCEGVIPFGPYHDHVLGYHKESLERPKKVFFTTYEELMNEPMTHVKRLAEFLGCPFDGEEEVEEIVRSCSIETLKSHEVNKSSELTKWIPLPYNSFFRQGHVGDHKNYMTKEMIESIDATTLEKFRGSGFGAAVAKDWVAKQEANGTGSQADAPFEAPA